MNIFNNLNAANIKEISITGKRWFQRSYGNTYHSVSVAAVVSRETAEKLGANPSPAGKGDVWIDLGYVSDVYGYERAFEQTALCVLRAALIDCPEDFKNMGYICQAATALNVPYSENVYDVSRKKDL